MHWCMAIRKNPKYHCIMQMPARWDDVRLFLALAREHSLAALAQSWGSTLPR